MHNRSGTILIIVAGICALLASMTLAFLARMRASAEEVQTVMRETQARIMLMAACNYIQEASRIGWKPTVDYAGNPIVPTPDENTETFGWIDVRDNTLGPKFIANGGNDDSRFPVRSAKRFPMYVMKQPPYAIQMTVTYNPILTSQTSPSVADNNSLHGRPYLRYPDPQPVTNNGYTKSAPEGSTVTDARFEEWALGDQAPRVESTGLSWFRIWRESGAVFVVTCGSGGSQGFRSWNEMTGNEQKQFGDETVFNDIMAHEIRLWYRVEWHAATPDLNLHFLDRASGDGYDHYIMYPENAYHTEASSGSRNNPHTRSMGGTIKWVQRLVSEPTFW